MQPGDREPRKRYRRKRKWQGAAWTPESQSANPQDGKYCKACHKWHGYSTLDMKHEKRGEAWVSLWICRVTKNVVGEMWLGDNSHAGDATGADGEGPEGVRQPGGGVQEVD